MPAPLRITRVDVVRARIDAHKRFLMMTRRNYNISPEDVAAHYCVADEVSRAFRKELERLREERRKDPLDNYCATDPAALECREYDL